MNIQPFELGLDFDVPIYENIQELQQFLYPSFTEIIKYSTKSARRQKYYSRTKNNTCLYINFLNQICEFHLFHYYFDLFQIFIRYNQSRGGQHIISLFQINIYNYC
ncbi:hypothetical protein pb186bvf_000322 [Paramecium bursaria]